MARKDTDTFNVAEWGQEPVHHYEADELELKILNAKLDSLARYCDKHRLPLMVAVGIKEDLERLRIAQRTVFPYARTPGVILAANVVVEGDLGQYTENVLRAIHELDVNRNVEHVQKDHAAQERRANFTVITNPES